MTNFDVKIKEEIHLHPEKITGSQKLRLAYTLLGTTVGLTLIFGILMFFNKESGGPLFKYASALCSHALVFIASHYYKKD